MSSDMTMVYGPYNIYGYCESCKALMDSVDTLCCPLCGNVAPRTVVAREVTDTDEFGIEGELYDIEIKNYVFKRADGTYSTLRT